MIRLLGGRRRPAGNDDPKPPLPRWAAWLIFGFIAYLIVIGNLHRAAAPPVQPVEKPSPQEQTGVHTTEFPALRRAFDLNHWARGIDPSREDGLGVRDFTPGTGRPVQCGDQVTLLLQGRTATGEPFDPEHQESEPLHFTVGDGSTYPAVERAVVGMRKGGERSVTAPPVLVYGKEKLVRHLADIELRMTLVALEPAYGQGGPPLLLSIPEDVSGTPARCGEKIKLSLRIWDSTGKRMEDAKTITLHLGKREQAIGLDYALAGIHPGETRLFVLPPSYQARKGKGALFDGKQTYSVEATRL